MRTGIAVNRQLRLTTNIGRACCRCALPWVPGDGGLPSSNERDCRLAFVADIGLRLTYFFRHRKQAKPRLEASVNSISPYPIAFPLRGT